MSGEPDAKAPTATVARALVRLLQRVREAGPPSEAAWDALASLAESAATEAELLDKMTRGLGLGCSDGRKVMRRLVAPPAERGLRELRERMIGRLSELEDGRADTDGLLAGMRAQAIADALAPIRDDRPADVLPFKKGATDGD